jgi:class 3 adenylate cyclase
MRQERKVVTALCADLVGSTALGEALDPEDVMDVVGDAVSRMVEVVEDIGGTVKDLAGDGVLALFGAPMAHEDDAERAVRAGLRIVREVETLGRAAQGRPGAEELHVRVGIATGLVVLGPVGAGHHVEYGATGDAVNTASRLQTAAAPGSVLVEDETYRGVSSLFDWREPQQLRLKGKRDPVRGWEASGMLAVRGGRRGPAAPEVAMVGRTNELAAADAAMGRVADGGSATLLVVGAPGLGKTRLVEELEAAWPAPGIRWFAGRCSSYHQRAYSNVGSFLQNWLFLPADRPEEAVRAALRRRMDQLLPPEAFLDVFPYLAAMLGLTLEGPEAARLADPSPEALQHRSAEALAHLFQRVAQDGPNVLVVEDAHWCDAASLEVLLGLVSMLEGGNVGVVVTTRPEGPAYQRLLEGMEPATASFEILHLAALSDDDQGLLLRDLIGADVLPVELCELLLRRAEGNPLFLGELVRSLLDAGVVRRDGDRTFFDRRITIALPHTVERVILSRIDRLPGLHHDVLTAGAVLGREFRRDLLQALFDVGTDLDPVLQELEELELLAPVGRGRSYRFRHALVGETARGSLLRRRRRALHRQAAEAIQGMFSDRLEEHAGTLAHHWAEAGEPNPAADFAEQSGYRACERLAYRDAVDDFGLALEMVDAAGGDLPRRGRLLVAMGEAAHRGALFERSLEAFLAASAVARVQGDDSLLASSAIGHEHALIASHRSRSGAADPSISLLREALAAGPDHSSATVRVRAALGRALTLTGADEEGTTMTTAAIDLAHELDDDSALAYALLAWRTTQLGPRRLLKRLAGMDEMVAAALGSGDLEMVIEGERLRLVDRVQAGDMRAAAESHRRLQSTIEALGQPQYLWYPPMWQAAQAISQARFADAQALSDRFRDIGRRLGYANVEDVWIGHRFLITRDTGRFQDLTARLSRGPDHPSSRPGFWALRVLNLADLGRSTEATAELRAGMGDVDDEPGEGPWLAIFAMLAEAATQLPPSEEAERLYRLLLAWEGQLVVFRSAFACLGSVNHFLGRLAWLVDRPIVAREHLVDAVDQNTSTGMVGWSARSKVALAEVLLSEGSSEDRRLAAAMLEEGSSVARRTGMLPLLEEAGRVRCRFDSLLHTS